MGKGLIFHQDLFPSFKFQLKFRTGETSGEILETHWKESQAPTPPCIPEALSLQCFLAMGFVIPRAVTKPAIRKHWNVPLELRVYNQRSFL